MWCCHVVDGGDEVLGELDVIGAGKDYDGVDGRMWDPKDRQ